MVTIPTIDQISGTTVMNKMRSLITNYIDFGTQVAGELSYMMNVIENLPQDITDVYNKATINAMFANVYQKSETYSKTEVNDLISTIGSFHAVIVDSLPQYGDEGVIYLLKIAESGENRYKEYIWVNRWELVGELSNVDLDNYYTKSQADAKFTQGVGNIGSDTKPIKIVNGQAVTVTNNLLTKVSTIMAYNTTGETIPANTVGLIQLGDYRGNDSDTFELSNNKVTIKKTGYYYIHFELLGIFETAGRGQVAISYNNDDEYTYAINYVQGLPRAETITGAYVLHITSPNQTIGITGWCDNSSIIVSNAKQATKLIIIKMS